LDFGWRWRVGIDRSPQLQPAGVDAPLDVRGLDLGFDPLLLDWHIRYHISSLWWAGGFLRLASKVASDN
jgi:hypothetical protein